MAEVVIPKILYACLLQSHLEYSARVFVPWRRRPGDHISVVISSLPKVLQSKPCRRVNQDIAPFAMLASRNGDDPKVGVDVLEPKALLFAPPHARV